MLDVNVYQKMASRTIDKNLTNGQASLHALFGLASEVGELHDIFQKYYQGHKLNEEHMKKECGDIMWMLAEFCTAHGWKLEEIMRMNIAKLEARYPNGFDPDKSLHRQANDI